jgi:hypothetical protein
MDLNNTGTPLSLNGLDITQSDIFYTPNLFVDTITPYQQQQITMNGNVVFNDNASFQSSVNVGSNTLQQYVRNQINVSGALVYDSSTGLIDGVHINNSGNNVILSLTDTNILSARTNAGLSQSLTLYCNYTETQPDGSKVLAIFPLLSGTTVSTTIGKFSTLQVAQFEVYQSTLTNAVFIPQGYYDANIYASCDNDNDKIAIYTQIYRKDYATSSETLIATSEELPVNTLTPFDYNLQMLNQSQLPFNAGDSFILKIFGRSLVNSNHVLSTYYQYNTLYSHIHTQFNTLNTFNFLPPLYNDGKNDISISQVNASGTDGYLSSIQYQSLLSITGSRWIASGNDIINSNTGSVIAMNNLIVSGLIVANSGLNVVNGNIINSGTLTNNGNVGIGTTTLSHKLNVAGNILIQGTTGSLWIGGETGLGQNGTRVHYTNNNTYYDNRGTNGAFIWRNDANLGSIERMRLTQTDLIMNTNFTSSGTGRIVGGVNFENTLAVRGNQTNSGTMIVNGNVGIGTTPNYKMHIKGDALFIEPTSSANPAEIILNNDTATNKFGSIEYTSAGNIEINNNFTGGRLISTNDFYLPRGTTAGRKVIFDYGSSNALIQSQGVEWRDLTTPAGNLGIYGDKNTMRFYAGGTQRMAISNVVDFETAPYVDGDPINTDDVVEGGINLYYNDTRARNAISATAPLSYNASTGQMSLLSANNTYEWRGQANTGTGDKYILVSRIPSGGGCGIQIRGVVGGFLRNETSKIDLAINVRGANAVYGSMETESASFATVISFMDFVLYTNGTNRDLYIILKSGMWYSYDFVINGQVDSILYTPTITTITPTGTVAIASILSNLRTYTIAGNVGIGITNPAHKLVVDGSQILNGANKSIWLGGETGLGNDGTRIHYAGDGNTYYDCKSSSPNFIWRSNATDGGTERMRLSNAGNVGIGTTNPTTRLQMLSGAGTQTILRYGNGTSSIYSGCDDGVGPWFGTETNHNLRITTNGATRMRIGSNTGNIAIGNFDATTNARLAIDGNLATSIAGVHMQATANRYYAVGQSATNHLLMGWIHNATTSNAYALFETWAGNNAISMQISGGNVGIGITNPTAKLTINDTAIVSNVETTTTYDNNLELFRASGTSYSISEVIDNGYGFKQVGTVPAVFFSNIGATDGSIYIDGNTANKVVLSINQLQNIGGTTNVALFSNAGWIIDMNIYIKQLASGVDNIIFKSASGDIGIDSAGKLYFLTKWSSFTTRLTWSLFGLNTSAQLNTWYRITIYFVNSSRLTTAIINGTNNGTLSGYDNSTIVSDSVDIGGATSNFRFYANNIRMVYSNDTTVNTLPLQPRISGNMFLLRVLRSDNIIALNRAGYLSGISNFKSWQLLRIDSISGTQDGYRWRSACFTKRSLNERFVLHYRYSAYASTSGIHQTWFYIHEAGTATYTNLADYAKNQWTVGSFGQRLYTTGSLFLPDSLPVGNYYIIFNNVSQLRQDFNDEIRLYLTTTLI